MSDVFHYYIELCRKQPFDATFITGCFVIIIGAGIHSAILRRKGM